MKYPKITDKDFYKKINKIYSKYNIPKIKKTIKQICSPMKFELQSPQKMLPKYINPHTNYNSILIFHKIGSGKTCSSIRIAEKWKHLRKIYVIVPASLKGNYRSELRSECGDYLTNKERELLKKLHPSSNEYKEIIEKSDIKINKYYDILSYNKFIEKLNNNNIKLNNSLLIIDEIQNLVSDDGVWYNTLEDKISHAKDLKLILLSATPMFDKPNELGLIIKLLRNDHDFPTGKNFDNTFIDVFRKNNRVTYNIKNEDLFKEKLKGYISYYRGAPSYVFPKLNVKYVRCHMSKFQYDAYKIVMDNEYVKIGKKRTELNELPNNFFIGTRMISNIVFPNKKINITGFESLTPENIRKNLEKYSTKFFRMMKKIKHAKGKIFIFSNFKEFGGIKSFIMVLNAFGYKNYDEYKEGFKRYAIWSSDTKSSKREEIKEIYNNINNISGNKIKILLGSPSIREGISLMAVKQVHILEPYWNKKRLEQVIGRAVRMCSHKNLDKDERFVNVYIYLSVHENEKETVDEYIYKLAQRKNNIVSKFEKLLKEVAIDCSLNKNANERDIVCVK